MPKDARARSLVLLALLFAALVRRTAARACPKGCRCWQTTVRCERMRYAEMPFVENDTTTLDLRHNQIASIPSAYFRGFDRLHTLLLTDNQITELKPDVFRGLKSLRHLYLYKNQIGALHPRMFEDLGKLVQLYLQSNNITILQSGVFSGLTDLERLSIHHNPIRRIDPNVFDPLENLVSLRLSQNNLECTCQLMWIKSVLNRVREADVDCRLGTSRRRVAALTNQNLGCCNVEIIRGPEDQRVSRGDGVVFRCFAVGCPTPHVTWSHNGNPVSSTGRRSIRRDGTVLFIAETHPADAGTYSCQVGKTTAAAKLSFHRLSTTLEDSSPVLIASPPGTVFVSENDSLVLPCSARGVPEPKIHWQKDKASIHNTYQPGDTSLKIKRVRPSDEGIYTCRAVNRVGKATAHTRVRVNVPPTIVSSSARDLRSAKGETARLWCRAQGKPAPVLTWWKNGRQRLVSSTRVDISGDLLSVRDLAIDDAGEYECRAENAAGVVKRSFRLSVRVTAPPVFSRSPADVDAAEGGTATFECETTRLASLSWLKDDRALSRGDRVSIDRTTGTLTIAKVRRSDAGTYLCLARNNDGAASSRARLTVSEVGSLSSSSTPPPPPPQSRPNLVECVLAKASDCSDVCHHRIYRTIDGSCNNLDHPQWGATLTPLRRMLDPVYEDGSNLPMGWQSDTAAPPSARLLSTQLISSRKIESDPLYTHMLMQFGQFLDHDLSHSPTAPTSQCSTQCRHDSTTDCFPISIPPNDRRIADRCMSFARSTPACDATGLPSSPRQQINQITAYIDGSHIYGSTSPVHDLIRNRTSECGLLNVGREVAPGKHLLPFAPASIVECRVHDPGVRCFLTGDLRGNEQVGLTAMHTIWLREHNRVAKTLAELNPGWDADRTFQEARKIVVAELQHITYTEFLPKILGVETMKSLVGDYAGYDVEVDASIANAFSTSAYRFGHTLIQPIVRRLDESFETISQGDLALHEAFFAPQRIVRDGGIDPILRGLFATSGKLNTPSSVLNSELTEGLFALAHRIALDLGALNIQRGRDHGLPDYLAWRRYYNMSFLNDFDGLKTIISNDSVREKLKVLYGKPENMDLWVGGLLEDVLSGGDSRVGPLFAAIIADQFRRTRDGDRFWYEAAGVFRPDQLVQIRRATLARVVCENGDNIDRVQKDVFLNVDEYESCSALSQIDLQFWKYCGECEGCHGEKGARSKRSSELESFVESSLGSVHLSQMRINNKTAVLEETVRELTLYVDSLKETVSVLQKQLGVCRLDDGKAELKNGQRITRGPCVECFCQNGQLICEKQVCPATLCSKPTKKRGECCPRC